MDFFSYFCTKYLHKLNLGDYIMSEETQRINLDDYIQTGEGGTAI